MGIQDRIEYLLQHHKKIRESIMMIRRNMMNGIDRDEIIEALALPGMDYDAVRVCPTNKLTDRQASIIDQIPREMREYTKAWAELREKVREQECELLRLDRAVAELKEPARNVILLLYYDCLSWADIKKKTKYSGGTLSNYRARGIMELVTIYKKNENHYTRLNKTELIGIEMNS